MSDPSRSSAGRTRSARGALEPRGHLDLLRRITAQMTIHHTLRHVLGAIADGLVQNADAALARIWLYTRAEACPVCRDAPTPDPDAPPDGARSLHLCASAGIFDGDAGPHHCLPLGMYLGGRVAEERRPTLIDALGREPRVRGLGWIAEHRLEAYAGYPLLFDGELEGVLGIFRRRPFDPDEFAALGIFASQAAIAIKNAELIERTERQTVRLSEENEYLQQELEQEHGAGELVGRSAALRALLRTVDQVAATDATVLLAGETGTGKELVARRIHARSARRDRALIKLNCGAIAPGLVESELFGHERGAFTGALHRRVGRFELADGGTLFLDEIGELPPEVQVKLLRVLQDGELERVGGGETLRTDARIVAATNRDLEADVAAGKFRADLFYRLSVVPLRVPPLRERLDDLPLLAAHFAARLERKLGKAFQPLARASLEKLRGYGWPGNVRELANLVERACVLSRDGVLDLAGALPASAGADLPGGGPPRTLEEIEREHILRVLASTGGVIQGPRGAARVLGLHANTLRSRMGRLGILRTRARPR